MNRAPAGTQPILSMHNVRIAIGTRVLADDVELDIRVGELWCVLGPNGSGKSTLLHTLAGLRGTQAGTVIFDGRAWKDWCLREAARRRGLLAQQYSYAFTASVMESVLLGRHPHMGRFGRPGAHDQRRVTSALEAMDLVALAERDVLGLSGGEQQRVALATLFAQDPTLFLLDEPTSHLDLAHQAALFRHLAALTSDEARAVILATHDYNLAAHFATHALLLYGDGRVLAGTAQDVLRADTLSALFEVALDRAPGAHARVFVPRW